MSDASWWLQNGESLIRIAGAGLIAGRQSLKGLKATMPWGYKRLTGPTGRALVAGRKSLELKNASAVLNDDFKRAASAKHYGAARQAADDASTRLKERAKARKAAAAHTSPAKSAPTPVSTSAPTPRQPTSNSPRTPPGGMKR
jgi:hypothetical protein